MQMIDQPTSYLSEKSLASLSSSSSLCARCFGTRQTRAKNKTCWSPISCQFSGCFWPNRLNHHRSYSLRARRRIVLFHREKQSSSSSHAWLIICCSSSGYTTGLKLRSNRNKQFHPALPSICLHILFFPSCCCFSLSFLSTPTKTNTHRN